MISDPYKVLGVSPDASDEEIQKAYRRLVKKYHPDVNPGDESAERKMREINAAYDQSGISEKEKLPEVSPTAEETRATEISADMAGATAVFPGGYFRRRVRRLRRRSEPAGNHHGNAGGKKLYKRRTLPGGYERPEFHRLIPAWCQMVLLPCSGELWSWQQNRSHERRRTGKPYGTGKYGISAAS